MAFSKFYADQDPHWFSITRGIHINNEISLLRVKIRILAGMQENLFLGFANNKGADQPAHLRRLISTFVIRFSENLISKFATGEISIF